MDENSQWRFCMMMDSPLGHPGEFLLVLVMFGLLAVGACLFIRSGGIIARAIYRLDHPDDPMPPRWRYRRGLQDAIEDFRNYRRYFQLHGFDWAVRTNLLGVACIAAGVLIAQNMNAVLEHFGWACGTG
jgi:hypothetical protein